MTLPPIDVYDCERCGADHKGLDLHRRSRPIQIGGDLFRFWALCPTTNAAINVRISTATEAIL